MTAPPTLDVSRIRAISLDLDDTLWPVWPAIARAEQVLHDWLRTQAPATARLFADTAALRAIRLAMDHERPDLAHDLSALRRESIRRALQQAGDDPALADAAFDAFFAARQQVDFYEDALDALARLAARWPLVALSNGNADVHAVGIGHHFRGKVGARECGFAKPDPRIFQRAAEVANVPGTAMLHVGDDAHLDVVGALEAGQQAVWVNRAGAVWSHRLHPHAQVDELGAMCRLLGV